MTIKKPATEAERSSDSDDATDAVVATTTTTNTNTTNATDVTVVDMETDSLVEEVTHTARRPLRDLNATTGPLGGGNSSMRTTTTAAAVPGTPAAASSSQGLLASLSAVTSKWEAIIGNRNVFRVLVFCLVDGGAYSIWNTQVFQVLIKELGGDKAVGWMSASSGVAQMVAALFSGFIGTRFLHQTVLRIGALAGLLAVLFTLAGVYELNLALFYVSQMFWGSYSGIVATTSEAIFADSVATGKRTFIYNIKWVVQTLSSVIGIIIAMILLVQMGNTWERSSIVNTMYGGLLVHPVAMLVLFSLRDKFSLKDDEEDGHYHQHNLGDKTCTDGVDRTGKLPSSDSQTPSPGTDTGAAAMGVAEGSDPQYDKMDKAQWVKVLQARGRWAPLQHSESSQCLSTLTGPANAHGEEEDYRCRPDAEELDEGTMTPMPTAASRAVEAATALKRNKNTTTTTAAAAAAAAETPMASAVAAANGGAYYGKPKGQGERAMIRYLNNQSAREHEAFRSEQDRLQGQPLQQLYSTARYYLHVAGTWEAVPFFVCLVDFLVSFGSGMTMRYLPLYFIDNKGTTPLTLMTAHLLICPLQAFLSFLVQYAGSHYCGRIPATIAVRLFGTFLMLAMGQLDMPLWLLLPIYVVRNASMNSTRGVTRSVIMDAVAKENRAKWSAFESFSSFTWAGSAVVGGYIAAGHSYQFSFTITALFHFCALAVLVPAGLGARAVEREMMAEQTERAVARKEARRQRESGAVAAEEVTVVTG